MASSFPSIMLVVRLLYELTYCIYIHHYFTRIGMYRCISTAARIGSYTSNKRVASTPFIWSNNWPSMLQFSPVHSYPACMPFNSTAGLDMNTVYLIGGWLKYFCTGYCTPHKGDLIVSWRTSEREGDGHCYREVGKRHQRFSHAGDAT